MSLASAGKLAALDGVPLNYLAAFTGYPLDTPVNEVAGGSPAYARKPSTFAAAAADARALSANVELDIPTGVDMEWLGAMAASSGGDVLARWPVGGEAFEYVFDPYTELFTYNPLLLVSAAKAIAEDDRVVLWPTAPTGFTVGLKYWAVNATQDDFQLSLTQGGAAVAGSTLAPASALASKIVVFPGSLGQRVFRALTTTAVGLKF